MITNRNFNSQVGSHSAGPMLFSAVIVALKHISHRSLNLLKQEAGIFIVCLVVVLSIWGFIGLTDEVREGDTQAFDDWVMNALHRGGQTTIGPSWLIEAGINITALGSVAVLTLVILFAASYLRLQRKYHAMWLLIIATISGQLLSSALKWFVGRTRPDEAIHLVEVSTASFPSGHSMLSAVVYLTIGALLAKVEPRRRVKAFWIVTAMVVTLLVGLSRIYVGVHYPTDVLAGWAAGLSWALICWLAARMLQRQGKVEGNPNSFPAADAERPVQSKTLRGV
jgi:undecaprenyl-diphosphatase